MADLPFTLDQLRILRAIASEGSYGPIERLPLNPGGVEIMAFVDRKRGVRLVETLATHRTNWRMWRFRPGDPAVLAAAKAIGFPEFGIFVMRNCDYSEPLKDIRTIEQLVAAVDSEAKRSDDGLALLISDMRAHRNPTRMKVLRALGWKLAKRLERQCPKCEAPGFGPVQSRRGLPASPPMRDLASSSRQLAIAVSRSRGTDDRNPVDTSTHDTPASSIWCTSAYSCLRGDRPGCGA